MPNPNNVEQWRDRKVAAGCPWFSVEGWINELGTLDYPGNESLKSLRLPNEDKAPDGPEHTTPCKDQDRLM